MHQVFFDYSPSASRPVSSAGLQMSFSHLHVIPLRKVPERAEAPSHLGPCHQGLVWAVGHPACCCSPPWASVPGNS